MFKLCKNWQKGQGLVEYALMLAIIIGSGWGIYSQTGVADSIKNVFGNASSLMDVAKKNTKTFDMKAVLKRLDDIQTRYPGNGYGVDYRRGIFSSLWIKTEDAADDKVKSLASELGATTWTYYNGLNTGEYKLGPDGGGLYWTTEKDFDSATLTRDYDANIRKGGWSQETVLSYRYDTKTGQYSVIENRAWLNQPGADERNNHNGLAQQPYEYGKPAGTTLGTYSTYEEAQKKYNEVKAQHDGNYIYRGTTQTK